MSDIENTLQNIAEKGERRLSVARITLLYIRKEETNKKTKTLRSRLQA